MLEILYRAHSGLRYLVLLVAVVALVAFAYGVFARRPLGAARGLMSAFTGLLDLQVLLGIGLVATGVWYGALVGHLVMMVVAVVVAHIAGAKARKAADERRALTLRLMGVVVALLCILVGITAIGRSPVGSRPMTQATR